MRTGDFNHSSASWDDLAFPTISKMSKTRFKDFFRSLFQNIGFLMAASEALNLIFTEKLNMIDNLAAGPRLRI